MGIDFDRKALGKRMKKARTRAKLTQDRFGEQLDVTKGAVSQWEGGTTMPDIRPIIALCLASRDNSADEILMAEQSMRLDPLELQMIGLYRQMPEPFQTALQEHVNKQWELAHPGKKSSASPFAGGIRGPINVKDREPS